MAPPGCGSSVARRRPTTNERRGHLSDSRATNGKIIRLTVEDEPFDVRQGELRNHERVLDLRAGVLRRSAEMGLADGAPCSCFVDPDRLVHAPVVRGDPLRGRAARRREHDEWDFDSTPPENYPLLLHYPYFDLYRKQVVKQADLVMALFYAGEYFTPDEKARDFAFHERLTVRESSLSACIQAAVAPEVGHVELAYDHFAEAAPLDLDDLQHNTRDGVHIASLAGACTAGIAGFGGLRDGGGMLSFVPRFPQALTRLALDLRARDTTRLRIEIEPTQATYTLVTGERLEIEHYGEPIKLTAGHPVRCPIPPASRLELPTRPRVREPPHRRQPAEPR